MRPLSSAPPKVLLSSVAIHLSSMAVLQLSLVAVQPDMSGGACCREVVWACAQPSSSDVQVPQLTLQQLAVLVVCSRVVWPRVLWPALPHAQTVLVCWPDLLCGVVFLCGPTEQKAFAHMSKAYSLAHPNMSKSPLFTDGESLPNPKAPDRPSVHTLARWSLCVNKLAAGSTCVQECVGSDTEQLGCAL